LFLIFIDEQDFSEFEKNRSLILCHQKNWEK